MAYVVGSVSVEVVPDFRNAQNEITAWFKRQPDELKVRVHPDFDKSATQEVQREAREAGNRIGEEMSQGAERGMQRGGTSALAKQVAKAEADIEKARRTEQDATERLRVAEARLDEARKAGNRSQSSLLSLENAVERQQRRVADARDLAARSTERLATANRELYEETNRLSEVSEANLVREQRARQKAIQRQIDSELKAQEKIIRERERLRRQAEQDEIRERARAQAAQLRQEKLAVNDLVKAYKQATTQIEKDRIQIEIDKQHAIQQGKNAGGLVTRAIREEVHQNAGLIALAIGGVLMAGAPVASAAAVALFGGVGAIAAAQAQEVQTAWLGAWGQIRTGAVEDARVIGPAYERMAANIADAFQDLRPELRNTFQESELQVDAFSASLRETAENALPGMMRAVQEGTPVVVGFGNLLESTGTGLGEFFDIISSESSTSGRVFDLLGDSMEELLPTLGNLVADGAELATSVLPALNAGLSGLNVASDLLGDALPTVAAGFLAFRAVTGVSGAMRNYAARLGVASLQGGRLADVQGKMAGALSNTAKALPVVGIGVGLVAAAMSSAEQTTQEWTDALIAGGSAAARIRSEAVEQGDITKNMFGPLDRFLGLAPDIKDAENAMDSYLDSLDPVTRAQVELQQATNDLAMVQGDSSSSAAELGSAEAEVARWSRELAEAQGELEMATRGVTEAMAEQAEAATARVDAEFAYQKAVDDLTDKQEAYSKAVRESGQSSEEASDALRDYGEGLVKVAKAAEARAIKDLPASMDDSQKAILGAQAALDELYRLQEQGFKLPPELEAYQRELENIVGSADAAMLSQAQLAGAFSEIGIAVETIPDSKTVVIDDENTTPAMLDKLRELNFTVTTMKDGTVRVSADTEEARGNLGSLSTILAAFGAKVTKPKVELADAAFHNAVDGANQVLNILGVRVATPTTALNSIPFDVRARKVQGEIISIDEKEPTPTVGVMTGPFDAGAARTNSMITTMDTRVASPTVTVIDRASGVLASISAAMSNIRDRSVTVTTYQNRVIQTFGRASGRPTEGPGGATGGSVEDIVDRFTGAQGLAIGGRPRGAISGPGGPTEDRVPLWGSPGEHMLDAKDVALMGGQAGVYEFRRMLNAGTIGGRSGTRPRDLVAAATGEANREVSRSVAGFVNNGNITVTSERELMRQAELRRREAMASIGV